MKKNNIIYILVLLIISGFLIFAACQDKKDNPVAPSDGGTSPPPSTPPPNPTVLKIDYTFTGTSLSSVTPLVFQIYNNKYNMTNQNNPLFTYKMDVTNGNVTISGIPTGTYYLFMYYDADNSGTIDSCSEHFIIYTNFIWRSMIENTNVTATPIVIPSEQTTSINLYLDYNNFYEWECY